MIYLINVTKMLRHLGGAKKIVQAHSEIAAEAGFNPLSYSTVMTWNRENKNDPRKGMSRERLLELMSVADHLGKSFDIRKFCTQIPLPTITRTL